MRETLDGGKVNESGQPQYTEEWIHTNKTTWDRSKNIIHLTPNVDRQN